MADLLHTQLRVQGSIERALDNFKKVGKGNLTAAKIRSRMANLKDLWTSYQDGDDRMAKAFTAANKAELAYYKDSLYQKTEDVYNATLDYMADCLEEIEPFVSPTLSSTMNHSRSEAPAVSRSHLPAIKLPPFDGKSEEWEHFRDRFSALIRDNPDLHDFARMHYLVSSLKGRALECISNLTVTAQNFDLAWETLKARYEDKYRILSTHLSSLLHLPSVARESSAELIALLDKVRIDLASLNRLGRAPAELWEDILVHVVVEKLDATTRKAWRLKACDPARFPSYKTLEEFLTSRTRALDDYAIPSSSKAGGKAAAKITASTATANQVDACPICRAKHSFHQCKEFLGKSPEQRRELVKKHKRCFNCLSSRHASQACQSKYTCRTCQAKHHSLLHNNLDSRSESAVVSEPSCSSSPSAGTTCEVKSLLASAGTPKRSQVLLATAQVRVSSSSGHSAVARALLDQGSEMTFISERLAQLLKITRIKMPISVSAVGGIHAGTVKHAARITVSHRGSEDPSFSTTALILKTLTSYTPQASLDLSSLDHLSDLSWADQSPTSSEPIDLIIGAELYGELLLDGICRGKPGQPIAQRSALGWVISGPLDRIESALDEYQPTANHRESRRARPQITMHHSFESSSLENEIRRFWESEEVPTTKIPRPEDEQCEQHFRSTHSRTVEGRYIVRLPFKQQPPIDIGHSRPRAEKCLTSLIARLTKNAAHKKEYSDFLAEYELLGHMRLAPPAITGHPTVYIPHHSVVRESSSTTRLRVVFNASSVTSNGTSLNDHLFSGPKLQSDIASVLLLWRRFRYVYTADIAKMYRQISVNEQDRDYQRILWRNPDSQVVEYQLLTVTYGMSCAPYLALRVLRQLVEDDGHKFPLAVPVLLENTYVDDVLFGSDDLTSIRLIREHLIGLLQCGGFKLRKWASNSNALLEGIDDSDHGLAGSREFSTDERIGILGISWNPSTDAFAFRVENQSSPSNTKRTVLSSIAKLYDPLGWVTPVIVSAKIFVQTLWRSRLDWDDALPEPLLKRWQTICSHLSHLNGLVIPRWLGLDADTERIELHGFCDASTVAFAAAVYMRIVSSTGNITITLLAGKSKVAPLKPTSIPRLELCAAVLLTRLMKFLRNTMREKTIHYRCWTDSTVVLAWVTQHPSRWQMFVANRVHEIQTQLPDCQWRHVSTTHNPADCASRGLLANEIIHHPLWWHGPPWLALSESEWPQTTPTPPSDVSLEEKRVSLQCTAPAETWELSQRYSSWTKLLRVTAYIMRFVTRCRKQTRSEGAISPNPSSLSVVEITAAKTFWIRRMQADAFPREIQSIQGNRELSSRSPLLALRPFLDDAGILRVGGRLSKAPVSFSIRHPILLAAHPLVTLLLKHTHLRALHAGPQLTLSVLRRDYWILRARSLVRSIIHRCVVCTRERAAIPGQLMGNLPAQRVSPCSRAFVHCGVDYAGPMLVRASAGRGVTSRKAYIAVFVCLSTKAVHIELVSDYSSKAFLNAFSRFCARRGLPASMYSDNGTTFIGADKELLNAYRAAVTDPNFLNKTASDQIAWTFIPPSAPHFGGLWEAGVRSVKHHLRRVLGSYTLTFEELSTLLCRIEACLNSRPIAPMSDSLNDYDYLTPGHFLIGSALTTQPEPSVLEITENRLSRWQLVQHITERFWKLWTNDYVNTLQQRAKWRKVAPSVKVGQLVLVRNATLPPCKWELGRVIRCHPGPDNLVRVVTVKTATSEYQRPIVKLCILPVDLAATSN